MLSISNLRCYRNEACLFKDLNFSLAGGQLLHIQGDNGSGKTTLLRIISGLSTASAGKVFWNGVETKEIREEYNSNLLYLGHQPPVKNDLTVNENLAFSLQSSGITVSQEQMDWVLRLNGLGKHKQVSARFLSQGQRYRLALSKLWFASQALWILDEPFGNLDPNATEILEDRITHHIHHAGLVILTSHRPLKINPSRMSIIQLQATQ
jgi:heme exporter protein A